MHQLRPYAMYELQGHLSLTSLKDSIGNLLLESLLPGTSCKASAGSRPRNSQSKADEVDLAMSIRWRFQEDTILEWRQQFRKRWSQSGWRERLDLDELNGFMKATTGRSLNQVQRRSRVISRHQSTSERCQATSHGTQLLRHRSVPRLQGRYRCSLSDERLRQRQ